MINIKIYEDGPRTILVFENTNSKIKDMIQSIITATMGNSPPFTQIKDVHPISIVNEQLPNIALLEANQSPAINYEISTIDLIETQGFRGYCQGWVYYLQHKNLLKEEQIQRMLDPLNSYTQKLKDTNIETVSDSEIISIIKIGQASVFSKRIPQLLLKSGFASLEDYLNSGRENLIDAYLYLVS